MAQRDLPNILIVKPPRADAFTSHLQPVFPPVPPPPPDPIAHAIQLTTQLQGAAKQSVTDRVAAGVKITGVKDGFYVEFDAQPGFELKLESLESKRASIELMNVRKTASGDQRATVFVPDGSIQHF